MVSSSPSVASSEFSFEEVSSVRFSSLFSVDSIVVSSVKVLVDWSSTDVFIRSKVATSETSSFWSVAVWSMNSVLFSGLALS